VSENCYLVFTFFIVFASLVKIITKTLYIRPRQRLYLNPCVKYEKILVNITLSSMNNEGIKVLHNICKVLNQCGQTMIILEAIKLNYMRWKNDVVLVS